MTNGATLRRAVAGVHMTDPICIAAWLWKHIGQNVRIYENCTLLKTEMISLADGVRIDAGCRLEGGQGITIGENVHIGSGSKLNIGGGRLIFGSHSGCSVDVIIATGNPDMSYRHISAAEPSELCHVIRQTTVIGEYACIYAGARLRPGVNIGEGAIVGMGAVVTHDIPPWEEWAGVPARKIGEREIAE